MPMPLLQNMTGLGIRILKDNANMNARSVLIIMYPILLIPTEMLLPSIYGHTLKAKD